MSAEKRPYSIELVDWDTPHRDAMIDLRMRVFVEEQGVPPDLELDNIDPTAIHAISRDHDGNIVGTGRLFIDPQLPTRARIGRMAVEPKHRGHGCGYVILAAFIGHAKKAGYKDIILSAQTHAAPFYAKAGFQPTGTQYQDCGIPHQDMLLSFPTDD